jgi:hypothetical protein
MHREAPQVVVEHHDEWPVGADRTAHEAVAHEG